MSEIIQWAHLSNDTFKSVLYQKTMVYIDTPEHKDIKGGLQIMPDHEAGYTDVPMRLYVKSFSNHCCVLRYDALQYQTEEIQSFLNNFSARLWWLLDQLDFGMK